VAGSCEHVTNLPVPHIVPVTFYVRTSHELKVIFHIVVSFKARDILLTQGHKKYTFILRIIFEFR